MRYKITYKHGLQNPTIVDAPDEEMAKREGLAYHRKNTGSVESVDKWPIDFVIDTVTPVED